MNIKQNDRPKDSKSEDSQTALIRAAKKLFADKGYDGATVKDIADSAGVNIALVSYFFDGKEGLYRACLEKFGKNNLELTKRILQPAKTKEEVRIRLELFFTELLNAHVLHPEVTSILHRECSMDFPIAQEVFSNTFLKIFQELVEFFAKARSQNLIYKNLDPTITALIHFGTFCNAARMDNVAKQFFGFSLQDKKHRENFIKHHLNAVYRNLGVDS